ncbi:hypothetical protein DL765_010347 [Monosporascus sp. GIB2]|nr:hypothetical protein DL765_010347 [Monosporascus sp. GIB2]
MIHVKTTYQPPSTRTSRYSIPEIPSRTPSSTPVSVQSYLEVFYTLRWIAIQRAEGYQLNEQAVPGQGAPQISLQNSQSRKSYDQKVESFLDNLYMTIENQQDPKKRILLKRCQPKSLEEAEQALSGMARAKLDKPEVITMKKNLLSAAESAFQAFLPLDQEGTICSKYWGAASLNIKTSTAERTVGILIDTSKKAAQVRQQLSYGKGPDPLEIQLPENFIKAWYYLLSCLLNMTWDSVTIQSVQKYARRCQKELDSAYGALLGEEAGKRLWELRAVLPSEMTPFLARRVLEDVTGEQHTVNEAYWERFRQLEMEVSENPLRRSHQSRISFLLEEVDVLNYHMGEQKRILTELTGTSVFQSRKSPFYDRFQVQALIELLNSVQAKRSSLSDLQRRAERLAESVRNTSPVGIMRTKVKT